MKKSILALSLFMSFFGITACSGSGSEAGNFDDGNYDDHDDCGKDNDCGSSSSRSELKGKSFKMGSMVDPRDGKTYKTIAIGNQVWMAENLAFYDTIAFPELAKGDSSGRAYTYDAAMNYERFSDSTYNDGICPPGWHLPAMAEFGPLKEFLQSECDPEEEECPVAEECGWGKRVSYWTSNPSGTRIYSGHGVSMHFNSYEAVSFTVDIIYDFFFSADFTTKSNELYVRCVQGTATDSVSAFKSFVDTREWNIEERRRADSLRQYVQNGAKNYFNESLEYSYFTDKRDGNVYGYLKIGNYIWMAENLRYMAEDYGTCDSYLQCGGRKSHQDSINYYSVGLSYNAIERDTVCPEGWHLPSKDEWLDLKAVSDYGGDYCGDDGVWDFSRHYWETMTATNSTGFTMLTTSRSSRPWGAGDRFEDAAFWTTGDTLRTILKVDTVYVDEPTEEPVVVTAPDDSDSTAVDSLPEVPERKFILDTTRTEILYHYYFEFDVSKYFDFDKTPYDNNLYSVRCVKDY
jgi:uncharacterized protein (TIGR02145 family)